MGVGGGGTGFVRQSLSLPPSLPSLYSTISRACTCLCLSPYVYLCLSLSSFHLCTGTIGTSMRVCVCHSLSVCLPVCLLFSQNLQRYNKYVDACLCHCLILPPSRLCTGTVNTCVRRLCLSVCLSVSASSSLPSLYR